MCEHPREPIYNKSSTHRIVSKPNGFWQLQKHSGHPATREYDPWVKAGQPASLRETHIQLNATNQPM